mgnify:CR=1 FL=1
MMDNSGLSVADALALSRDNGSNNDGFFGGDGSWIFFLFFLLESPVEPGLSSLHTMLK